MTADITKAHTHSDDRYQPLNCGACLAMTWRTVLTGFRHGVASDPEADDASCGCGAIGVAAHTNAEHFARPASLSNTGSGIRLRFEVYDEAGHFLHVAERGEFQSRLGHATHGKIEPRGPDDDYVVVVDEHGSAVLSFALD